MGGDQKFRNVCTLIMAAPQPRSILDASFYQPAVDDLHAAGNYLIRGVATGQPLHQIKLERLTRLLLLLFLLLFAPTVVAG